MLFRSQTEFTVRVATILLTEETEFVPEDLDVYVKSTYQDLRKCINMVQQNIVDNKLQQPGAGESGESDWILEYVALFQLGKVSEARKLIVSKEGQKNTKVYIVNYMRT